MKTPILFLSLLFWSTILLAQSNDAQRKIITFEKQAGLSTQTIEIPIENIEPFLAFSISWEDVNAESNHQHHSPFGVRFFESNKEENAWENLHINPHEEIVNDIRASELIFADRNNKFVQIKITDTEYASEINNIQLHFYSPGKTETTTKPNTAALNRNNACTCPMPTFENRNDWCPSGDCPMQTNPTTTIPTHLIVHHSAGTNASSDWAGVVRSIWDFHVNTNGWSDVGYNWLVDPNGVLYEGRGDNILGAHFCAQNSATMGVCMLGDFTNIEPTENQLNKLTELLAWKICDIDEEPLEMGFHSGSGLTLNYISGHRDGCNTACPGDMLYPLLPGIRTNVNNYVNNDCTISNEFPAPTNLTAQFETTSSIRLMWMDNSNDETKFLIERSQTDNSNFEQIASIPSNVEFFLSSGLEMNTTYYYRVRAKNDQDTSAYSNEAFASTMVTAIENELNENNVQLFPNPTDGAFTIDIQNNLQGKLAIKIQSLTGKTISEISVEKNMERINIPIDVRHLPVGVYLVQVVHEVGGVTFRLIKN